MVTITQLTRRLALPVLMACGMCTPYASRAERLPAANSPLLYGYNDVSGYNVTSPLQAGVYSFQAAFSDMRLEASGSAVETPSYAGYANGTYYAVVIVSNWLTGDKTYIKCYDAVTWELKGSNQLEGIMPQTGLVVSQDGTKAYTLANNMADFSTWVYAVDLSTYVAEPVMEAPAGLYFSGLCLAPDGNLILFNSTDYKAHKLDLQGGTTAEVSETEMPLFDNKFCAFYDSHAKCIWMAGQVQGQSKLFRLNPDTYEWEETGVMPGGEIIRGLYVPDFAAGVPDAVSNVDFEYARAGSNNAVLSFDAPTLTYGGSALSGDLTAVITIDGAAEETAVTPGQNVTLDKVLANGNHIITIETKNGEGVSPARRFSTFTGLDSPAAVQNLTFAIDAEGVTTVEWTAPDRSVNGGTFDKNSLTYTVVRNPNEVVVADGISATSFSEQLGEAFAHYSYTVIPSAGGVAGEAATTGTVDWGVYDIPPFCESFDMYEDINRFEIVDVNGDESTWSSYGDTAIASASGDVESDDWLFTPAVKLDAALTYTFSFDFLASSWDNGISRLEVYLSEAPTAESAKTELLPAIVENEDVFKTHIKDFTIAESGVYYIGIHNTTPAGGAQANVDNIAVAVNSSVDAPAQVSDLAVVPADKGELSATISFKAPVATVSGGALGSIDYVEVSRYGSEELVETLTGVRPGASLSCVDAQAVEGRNIYAVTAYADGVKGMTDHITVFVGNDVPGEVCNVRAFYNADGKPELVWDAVDESGVHGGYVNPDEVTYNIYRADDISYSYAPVVAQGVKGTSFVDDTFVMPDGESQRVVRYTVSAVAPKGEGAKAPALFTMGIPYATPFAESFADKAYANDGWNTVASTGSTEWVLEAGDVTVVQPYDADDGMVRLVNNSFAEGTATLRSPRVELGADAKYLSFMMYHGAEAEPEDLMLTVYGIMDDAAPVELAEISYNDGTAGWQRHAISLDRFAGSNNMIVELKGYAVDGSASVFVDNFKVMPAFDNDIELTGIEVAPIIKPEANSANVTVTNVGRLASTFDVKLYRNDAEAATVEVTDLEPGRSTTVTVDMAVTPADALKTIEYRAEVVFDKDEFMDNNVSRTVSAFVKRNTLPQVEIEGQTADGEVILTWDAPAPVMAAEITDSFEDYSAYALNDFGDWITVDGDGLETEFSKYWNQITNAKSPMAWEVWNNNQVETDGFFGGIVAADRFAAHTGNSCLVAFTAIENSWFGEMPAANDNWLISPEIISGTDVTFWLRAHSTVNAETIELLYTAESIDKTAPNLDSFTVLGTYSLMGPDWRQISATLPADARHFAIRHCTANNGYIVMLDDITYTPMNGELAPVTPMGYNVYRDGKLLTTTTEETYTDRHSVDGIYSYYVTSLWDKGESGISNIYEASVTVSVENIVGDGSSVTVAHNTLTLTVPTATRCVITAVNGVVISDEVVGESASYTLGRGVYVVSMGGANVKVVIK